MAIGRKIVGHFKHSHLAMSRLREIQTELGLSKNMLQQDTPTRLNSTFYMMSSLLAQKRALGAYGAEFKLTDSSVKMTKATLLEAIKQWFNGIYTEPLYFLATILDPRYKDRFFDQATKQRAK